MSESIRADELQSVVESALKEYGTEIRYNVETCVEWTANETVKRLKETSPKLTGKYSRAWKINKDKTVTGNVSAVIYNGKYYRLTHLLENGHATLSGGRTKPQPHIAPAQEQAEQLLLDKLKEALATR